MSFRRAGASQPTITFSCIGSLPCMVSTSSTINLLSSGSITPATGVVSFVAVAERTASGSGQYASMVRENGLAGQAFYNDTASGKVALVLNNVTRLNVTASSTGLFDAMSDAACVNGASSVINVDGTETTGSITGVTSAGNIKTLAGASGSDFEWETEAGYVDNVVISSGNRTSLCHNMHAYWGTSTSCQDAPRLRDLLHVIEVCAQPAGAQTLFNFSASTPGVSCNDAAPAAAVAVGYTDETFCTNTFTTSNVDMAITNNPGFQWYFYSCQGNNADASTTTINGDGSITIGATNSNTQSEPAPPRR